MRSLKKQDRKNQYNRKLLKHGYWEIYYTIGMLRCKGSYINGKRDGIWEFYWENGNIMYKGNYIGGNKDGLWRYYDQNGLLLMEIYF
jgi:antitoxin component YwqK of YwqJK toxin-antitoxin module